MSVIECVTEARDAIRARAPLRPAVGVVLGSGLAPLARAVEGAIRIPFAEIPHFPIGAVEGHGRELVLGTWAGAPVAVLTGRAHVYEGFSASAAALPVRVLVRLGVRVVVLTCAAGAVNVNFRPGEVVVVTDHINLMGDNPLRGPHEEGLGPRFPDMTEPYDPLLREVAEKVSWKAGVTVRRGVYVAFPGPSYETPTEIRMARALGADVVGMSTVPEVLVARQMGARVLALACVTNMAAGVLRKPLSHAEVLSAASLAREGLSDVLAQIVAAASSGP